MARLRCAQLGLAILPALLAACGPDGSEAIEKRRALARKTCEDAVLDQIATRATAHFPADGVHVYYDSVGGAAVSGIVTTTGGPRNFACILNPTADSGWSLSAAKLLN
jgi:hypothetical protein